MSTIGIQNMDLALFVPKYSKVLSQGVHCCGCTHCYLVRVKKTKPSIGIHWRQLTNPLSPTNLVGDISLGDEFLRYSFRGVLKTSIGFMSVLLYVPKVGTMRFPIECVYM